MHSSGSMNAWPETSSFLMQSAGQTSMHAAFISPMQGWVMMNAMSDPPSSPALNAASKQAVTRGAGLIRLCSSLMSAGAEASTGARQNYGFLDGAGTGGRLSTGFP